ncbi:MAG: winged helix-turn-helix transcriptional regulator [Xanthomonadales bacterium]|nr:winged helix-turn-helix transcriptional regulator [Xanthomonadales bacterium]
MGIISQGKDLWNALFTRTQRQVLGLMFGHPDRSYYANEVVRLAGVGTGSVQRELKRLAGAGLLSVEKIGNQKHYRANRDCPIFGELRSIVVKTFGVIEQLRNALAELDTDICYAMLYGEAVRDPAATTLDLLIVSADLEYADAITRLTSVENRIGRNIRLTLLDPESFAKAREEEHAGLDGILNAPRIVLRAEPGVSP